MTAVNLYWQDRKGAGRARRFPSTSEAAKFMETLRAEANGSAEFTVGNSKYVVMPLRA